MRHVIDLARNRESWRQLVATLSWACHWRKRRKKKHWCSLMMENDGSGNV